MKIVVISCDLYADTCRAFDDRLKKVWPDCPWEVIFVTNSKKLQVNRTVYYLGDRPDIAFGWRLKTFLRQYYDDSHLLFMMSDYLLKDVNAPVVQRAAELCVDSNGGIAHCRLRPMPPPQFDYPEPGFGRIDKRKRYCLSLQPGIWERETLMNLLRESEDPWKTEIWGSGRVAHNVKGVFLSTKEMVMPHTNYYYKGQPQGVNWVIDNVDPENWTDAAKSKKAGKK